MVPTPLKLNSSNAAWTIKKMKYYKLLGLKFNAQKLFSNGLTTKKIGYFFSKQPIEETIKFLYYF
jgi:hypothetical protein